MLNGFKITGKLTIGFGIVLALFGVAVFLQFRATLSFYKGSLTK